MRILWVRREALDPIRGGGHIRTLNVMRQLVRTHEIDLLSFEDDGTPVSAPVELPSVRATGIPVSSRGARSARTTVLPSMVAANESAAMRDAIAAMERQYDRIVVDFPHIAQNLPTLKNAVLFQHNVETSLLYRQLRYVGGRRDKLFLIADITRFFLFERRVCRAVRHVWAVSSEDAAMMRSWFGVTRVTNIGTGVDVDWFSPPPAPDPVADIVFVGSMNWGPNADGIQFFVTQILPIIRKSLPGVTLALVGRNPEGRVLEAARRDPGIRVTGTVADVRPYFWGAGISIVPLRIGGGTRIKIYEANAAGCPVVSTAIGCEGLDLVPDTHLLVADDAAAFAAACVRLLTDRSAAATLARDARAFVERECTWEQVGARCEIGLMSE